MRYVFIVFILFAAWSMLPAFSAGDSSIGIRNAWAVKPPTVQEREESVSNPDQHKKAVWFGRKSHTTGGTFCKCGVSKADKSKCYHPEPGQICRNPETGETHIVEITDWNNPVRAFEGR